MEKHFASDSEADQDIDGEILNKGKALRKLKLLKTSKIQLQKQTMTSLKIRMLCIAMKKQ